MKSKKQKLSSKLTDKQVQELIRLSCSLSSRAVSKALNNIVTKSTVNNVLRRYRATEQSTTSTQVVGPKVLLLDIETTPEISYTWGRWKQFISQGQVIEHPYVLTWAARWLGSDVTMSRKLTDYPSWANSTRDDKDLVTDLWALMDEADYIVAHNGDKFDIPWITSRAIFHGLPPISPTKYIDTLKAAKKLIRVPSYSLEALCVYYGLTPKQDNEGFSLWRRCIEGDADAFVDMETYNVGDIDSLQDLYLRLRPYMKEHPNGALYYPDSERRCGRCGSTGMELIEAQAHTSISTFDVYRCTGCGTHHRARKNKRTKDQMETTMMAVQ